MPGDAPRGQAYTIEGVIGAIVVVSAVVLGLQAVDIAPWTDDTPDQEVESLRTQVADLLAAAEDRDALRTAALCIDGDGTATPHPAVAAGSADADATRDRLGILLNRTLDENGFRYTASVERYNESTGAISTTPLTPDREPTSASVSVSRTIVLLDDDLVYEFDGDAGACRPAIVNGETETIGERYNDSSDRIYLENADENSEIYAVVRIRVIAW